MDLLASYDSSSESEPDLARVPLIPPLPDESSSSNSGRDKTHSTNSTFNLRSTVSSSSAALASSTTSTTPTLAGQGFSSSSSCCSTDDSQFSQPAPRFPTRLPPPQVDRTITATTTTTTAIPAAAADPVTTTVEPAGSPGARNADLTPAEQRSQLLRLAAAAAASSPPPEIPLLPAAPDGGRLVAQFLALKSPSPSFSSSSSAPPVHFNVKFAASMQLHDPGFIARQAAYIGVGKIDNAAAACDDNDDIDGYISKFVRRGDRNVARAAVRRQRAAQRTRVEFTSAATTAGAGEP